MLVRPLLLAVTSAALLTGCHAQMGVHGGPRMQIPGDVTCASNPCSVTLDPLSGEPPENIIAAGGNGRVIIWHIPQHSSLRFDSPGIVFAAPGANVFKCQPNPTPNGKTVVCRNEGTVSESGYKYTVRLVGKSPIDPFVWNF